MRRYVVFLSKIFNSVSCLYISNVDRFSYSRNRVVQRMTLFNSCTVFVPSDKQLLSLMSFTYRYVCPK
jgi:hypothetical protein